MNNIYNILYKLCLIAVKVVPHSIKHTTIVDCESQIPLEVPSNELPVGETFQVIYTYSVKFVVSFCKYTIIQRYFN